MRCRLWRVPAFLPAGSPAGEESPVLFSACIIRIPGHTLLDRQNPQLVCSSRDCTLGFCLSICPMGWTSHAARLCPD